MIQFEWGINHIRRFHLSSNIIGNKNVLMYNDKFNGLVKFNK